MKLKAIAASDVNIPRHPRKLGSKADRENNDLKVTKISQQVKRQDRYSVYINEKYTFSLHEYQLAGSGLKVGKILTEDELKSFATESQFGKAYERALNYVMIRPRSEKEIRDYLIRTYMYPKPKTYIDKSGQRHFVPRTVDKEETSHIIERVLERLSKRGYINDEAFARSWVASRQLHKKSSIRKLQQELFAKGVNSQIIETVLQNEDVDDKANLHELIAKKSRLPKYKDKTKLTQYLVRQGFSYSDVKEALS